MNPLERERLVSTGTGMSENGQLHSFLLLILWARRCKDFQPLILKKKR